MYKSQWLKRTREQQQLNKIYSSNFVTQWYNFLRCKEVVKLVNVSLLFQIASLNAQLMTVRRMHELYWIMSTELSLEAHMLLFLFHL